ncbi:uncharacterized protein A1O5_01261 [Cladophialophora psammophila CBS 110553]|uniref:Uncharacterized protein n=1 Tax=Cladophialophora psammophila CBS 110553 TaxID=1182543 RepID=W9X933_9EURO|nr:uncharacterized protein A1O5_01261 [Cladophialophora psammophila CBS 110553]EXJ76753.1 hypothetical protein A1O5_01261 [Cladophialophora psammophila CBS 110553]
MVLSFIAAIVSAIVHHILYSSLNGRSVTYDFEQQLVTSAGTALAFFVKVLLAVSSALAFTQCLWFSLRSRSVKIRTMDSIFGVLGNPLEFLDLRFWLGHPVLFLTAATTWLIPLSAIFTPATISVGPKIHTTAVITNITQRDRYIAENMNRPTDGLWQYPGVSTMLFYMTQLTLLEAAILSLPGGSPAQNLSYHLTFCGPAIQCLPPSNQTRSFILSAMAEYINEFEEFPFFTSFYPVDGFGPGINATFFDNVVNVNVADTHQGLDLVSSDAAKVYFTLWVDDNMTAIPDASGNMEILECSLHNASYNAQVELRGNGQQTISAARTILKPVPAVASLPDSVSESEAANLFEYFSLMQSYVDSVLGSTTTSPVYALIQDSQPVQFTQLGTNPVLMPYLLPSSAPVDFNQFTTGLEDMFQNLTLSYRFASLPDTTLVPGTPKFNSHVSTLGTLSFSLNTFTYNPRTLMIAYGLAIFLSAVCLACGLAALYSNGASYTNNFSTVLRMTRDHGFGEFIQDERDCTGADPLPTNIADVEVTYVGEGTTAEGDRGFAGGIKVLR